MSDVNTRPAFYYPNLSSAAQVQVVALGADTILASHDLNTACSEDRHFVDYEYLKTILGVAEMKRSVVETPCTLLTGTRREPGERVLGMLPSLKVYVHVGKGTDNNWSVHALSNVLVVDALPVPLHISLKTLDVYPNNQRNGEFKKTSLPAQYQSHPYWDERLRREITYIGVNY